MKRDERKEAVRSVLEPYLKARKDKTIYDQYNRLAPGADCKIRTVLSPTGTETSRLSSSEAFYEPSTNLQNVSNTVGFDDELYRVRDIVRAPPGWTFLAVDYDKAEAVMNAAYSEDWAYYDMLQEGVDVHTWHAGQFFHDGDESLVQKQERNVCKNVTYASNYDATVKTITRTVNRRADQIGRKLSEAEVEAISEPYLEVHGLRAYWERAWRVLLDRGYAENAFGFRRQFLHPDEYKRRKEMLAFFPQSTVACAINESLISIFREGIDQEDVCHTLLQVHDELFFMVREDEVEKRYLRIKSIMEREFEINGRTVFIPASGKAGNVWESSRGGENKDRMRGLE